ncbi:protein-PII uridylyltransferase [Clostridium acetobutylicum]|nr:protein-PII uridylyltransferase [Clostridium acetobutylicum]
MIKKRGFTLIELIISMSIIAILGAILVPNIYSYIRRANNEKAKDMAALVFQSAMRSYMKEGKFDNEQVLDNINEDLSVKDNEVQVRTVDDSDIDVDFKCSNLSCEVKIDGRRVTYDFKAK